MKHTSWLASLKEHWLMIVIVILASLLRTWRLDSHGILFSDAGRDLLAAEEAVTTNKPPLLGISSSVPRFHQGPYSIWIHMAVFRLFGHQTLAYALTYAFIGIVAVVMVYEFTLISNMSNKNASNKQTAIIAALIMAVSPLAVAHARVPYHITPLPLVTTLFLLSLFKLWNKEKFGVFWSVFTWALLMQFELAMFGLLLAIVYVLWKKAYTLRQTHITQMSLAFLLGFWPQIIHDLTHPLSENQLAQFIMWVAYRLASLTGFVGDRSLDVASITKALEAFGLYGQRIFSTDYFFISAAVALALVASTVAIKQRRIHLPVGIHLTIAMTMVLTISYLIHGGPSEAYFPPFTVLGSIVLAYALTQLFHQQRVVLSVVMTSYALFTIISIVRFNFFVSNHQSFSYGPSTQEQRTIITMIGQHSGGQFSLDTTDSGRRFSSYLDNYRWLSRELGFKPATTSRVYYIDMKTSLLSGYPGMHTLVFESRDVYFY